MDIAEYQHAEDMKRAAAYVLEYDLVSGPAKGIARSICDRGWNSLTSRQQDVFRTYALPEVPSTCEWCGADIPLNELEFNDSGLCSLCFNKKEKFESGKD